MFTFVSGFQTSIPGFHDFKDFELDFDLSVLKEH
jgi:hypothetical protein